jgi:hypothetical protein
MKAFHNDPQLKANLLVEIAKHRRADQLIQGTYGKMGEGVNPLQFKGCAIGCSIHSYALLKGIKFISTMNHSYYESLFGIPRTLAFLEDFFFEELPESSSQLWPERFMESINVGVDLSLVWPKFVVWMLVDEHDGVIKFVKKNSIQYFSINHVAELYQRVIKGEEVSKEEFSDAANEIVDDSVYATKNYYAMRAYYTATVAASVYALKDYSTASIIISSVPAYAVAAAAADAYQDSISYKSKQADKLIEILHEEV